jgi:hypothetical protein
MSTTAARMRDYRARQKTGSIVIPVFVCETKLSVALVEAGLLQVNAVDQLKQTHGPRITAHLLYHQARALTLEADRASEQDQHEQT